MRIRFIKACTDKFDKEKIYKIDDEIEFERERAIKAIQKGYAVLVKEKEEKEEKPKRKKSRKGNVKTKVSN